jgi:HD-GYP domain-containing protein (c-di-GMP phosphodiesterase class II)
MTDEEQRELKDLALQCEALGEQIDKVTGRKNNSKNVAEMVFKLAHEMQCSSYDSMLYFCASMVYDAGFLSVDPQIFLKEKLSDEEKYEIRGHVKHSASELTFVPEKYRKVFLDAALMHHENMDGSGYPEGIKGSSIPLIARIIRVVESFISLISRRNYRGIFDKEAAINELKNNPGLYDKDVVRALDQIV